MIKLAISTGISMSEWLDAGDRAIFTAIELLDDERRRHERHDRDGRQMSG